MIYKISKTPKRATESRALHNSNFTNRLASLTDRKKFRVSELSKDVNSPKHRVLNSFSPGFTFSRISRFDKDIFEKYKRIFYSVLSPGFHNNLAKSEKNCNKIKIPGLSPQEKLDKIKEFSRKEDIKGEITRLTRQNILSQINQVKSGKLVEKFNRFEMRRRKFVKSI
jgi:hypothetical protein